MQSQSTPAEQDRRIDDAIAMLLLDRMTQRPWSREEIEREMGCDVTDSLARLYGAGLIHRLDGFAWATRAALAADAMVS